MNSQHVINPVENAKNVDRYVLYAERGAIIVAALITSAGFFVWGRGAATQYTDNGVVQIIAGLVAAAVAAFITDLAFRRFLEEVVYQLFAAPMPKPIGYRPPAGYIRFLRVLRWLLLTGIVVALFLGDYYSVYTIKDPFANQARRQELIDVDAERATLASLSVAQQKPIEKQIGQVKNDIAAAERKAEHSNSELKRLKAAGNGWASKEIERAKNRATKKMRDELAGLQSTYSAALSNGVRQDSVSTALALRTNQERMEADANNRHALSFLFFIFGIGSKALAVAFRCLLVISFLAKSPNLDANRDGQIDGADVTAAARSGDADFQ